MNGSGFKCQCGRSYVNPWQVHYLLERGQGILDSTRTGADVHFYMLHVVSPCVSRCNGSGPSQSKSRLWAVHEKKIMSIQPPEGCHKYKKLSQNVPGNIAKKFAVYPEV